MAGVVELLKRKKDQFMSAMGGLERTGQSWTNSMKNRVRRMTQAGEQPRPAQGSTPGKTIPMEVRMHPPGAFSGNQPAGAWKPKESLKRKTRRF